MTKLYLQILNFIKQIFLQIKFVSAAVLPTSWSNINVINNLATVRSEILLGESLYFHLIRLV